MPLPKPKRLGMPYICSVVESSMNLDFDAIIPDVKDRPGVRKEPTEQASDAAPDHDERGQRKGSNQ